MSTTCAWEVTRRRHMRQPEVSLEPHDNWCVKGLLICSWKIKFAIICGLVEYCTMIITVDNGRATQILLKSYDKEC